MLSNEQLQQYQEDGYLIIPHLFSEEELQPVIDQINDQVDELANLLYDSKQISDKHESEGFLTRLTKLEQDFPGAAVLIHTNGVLSKAIADVWSSPKLLDIIEQMIGPDIAGHPVWNLRSKTPNNPLVTVPWHQDTAYLAEGSERTFQPTAWIPLVDANHVNGALQVVRGAHKQGKVYPHYLENKRGHKDSWYLYIPDEEFSTDDIVTCEVEKGGVVFLNNLVPHRSTENFSDIIRWSIDLRWQRPGEVSGYEGIKDCIRMRSSHNPNFQIDWSSWAAQSRQVGLKQVFRDRTRAISKEDAKVTGPWMDRWSAFASQ